MQSKGKRISLCTKRETGRKIDKSLAHWARKTKKEVDLLKETDTHSTKDNERKQKEKNSKKKTFSRQQILKVKKKNIHFLILKKK